MSSVYYHLYEMTSRGALNARSTRKIHPGALIRCDEGYGCLHPWPELGDAPLAEQLRCLTAGIPTPLTTQTLRCCALDAAARKSGASLFAGLAIPNSHATLTALPDAAECLELRREGFVAVKIKVTPEIASQPRLINCLAANLGGMKLRLDFNFTLDRSAFLTFAAGLGAETRQAIDFIEDPCPFDPEVWRHLRKSTGLPLAADRIDGPIAPDVCDFRILKPACQEIPPQAGRFVITSYMDHPVGQLFAAWEAAQRRATVDLCGLLTHRLFDPNAFSESLTPTGPQLFPPSGTGLGWDTLLMSLPWKRLDAQ